MYRWTESGTLQGTDTPANSLAGAVLDILSDALKGKVRVKPSTFTAILEVRLLLQSAAQWSLNLQ